MAEATQAEKLTGVQKLVPDRLAHVVFRTQNVDPMAEWPRLGSGCSSSAMDASKKSVSSRLLRGAASKTSPHRRAAAWSRRAR